MKTVTVITIILFLVAASLFGIVGLKFIGVKLFSDSDVPETSETEEVIPIIEGDPKADTEEDKEEDEVKIDPEDISEIEIYLDGDRESGIFLGNAVYCMTSEEAFMIYGEDFSESGFLLAITFIFIL